MADVHKPEVRSYNMSRIRGKETRPEMLVRKFLFAHGFRYRVNVKTIPGKPDIVLKKYKTIIDVRGCFWHLHSNCKYGDQVTTPSVKITLRRISAVKRDKIKMDQWKKMGWSVTVIWAECELEPRKKNSEKREIIFKRLLNELKSGNTNN